MPSSVTYKCKGKIFFFGEYGMQINFCSIDGSLFWLLTHIVTLYQPWDNLLSLTKEFK